MDLESLRSEALDLALGLGFQSEVDFKRDALRLAELVVKIDAALAAADEETDRVGDEGSG